MTPCSFNTEDIIPGSQEPASEPSRIDERVVAEIWERQAFDHDDLARIGLSVLYRGFPSDAGGPDYQEALLVRDGRQVIGGDVEFHVHTMDWYRHGHQGDPGYNKVVLHVVWNDDGTETRTVAGRVVPVLSVGTGVRYIPARQPSLGTHPCVAAFSRLDELSLRAAVVAAGLDRLQQRADRFAADATVVGHDEMLYTALLEGMGYASNRRVFRALAEAVPFAWLVAISPSERAAVLLDAAGLGPPGPVDPPARLSSDQWRLSRLRPANHPRQRLAAIAVLLERLGASPSQTVVRTVHEATRVSTIRSLFHVPKALGTGRVDEIVASVILPFVAAMHADGCAASLFHTYPAPPATRWTRLMQDLLAKAGHDFKVRSAVEHQGLHALYHENCRYEKRSSCPICG